jgi:hypothetical protein
MHPQRIGIRVEPVRLLERRIVGICIPQLGYQQILIVILENRVPVRYTVKILLLERIRYPWHIYVVNIKQFQCIHGLRLAAP